MNRNPSKSIPERISDWLRGMFSSPDTSDRTGANNGTNTASATRERLPDGGTLPDTDQTLARQDMTAEEQVRSGDPGTLQGDRNDLDEASGSYDVDDQAYPSDSTDASDVYNLHDAVGGDDAAADAATDGPIDTSRDSDFNQGEPGRLEADNVPEPDQDVSDLSEQDELTTIDGARSDEFAAGGYKPGTVDQDDVEAAAEPVNPLSTANDPAAGITDREVPNEPDEADTRARGNSTPGPIDREEIEGASEHAAGGLRNDEGGGIPGRGEPEDFDDPGVGTVEPSRSAIGNEVDDEPDALGTTLSHEEESASPFDSDEANLASQEELTIGEDETGNMAGDLGTREGATTDSYADFPDDPGSTDTNDTGFDDFAGDDYPSDHRIDPLGGDDILDAETPDADEFGSSAGDLDTAPPADTLITSVTDTATDVVGDSAIDRTIDQDSVATSDEHVGGEEPDFADTASRGTDEAEPGIPGVAGVAYSGDAASGTTAGTEQYPPADDVPLGAVRGDGTTNTPEGYPIKGNAGSKIYHLPEYPSYNGTKADYCFASEQDAIDAGYRAPGKRNRGRGKKR